MSREARLRPTVERYLGPVAVAQFIEIGWFTFWPIGLTKAGRRAFRNGYGFWDGHRQLLPIACTEITREIGHPYPNWSGRLSRLPHHSRTDNSTGDDHADAD
jgi:hypothetical protein